GALEDVCGNGDGIALDVTVERVVAANRRSDSRSRLACSHGLARGAEHGLPIHIILENAFRDNGIVRPFQAGGPVMTPWRVSHTAVIDHETACARHRNERLILQVWILCRLRPSPRRALTPPRVITPTLNAIIIGPNYRSILSCSRTRGRRTHRPPSS